MLVVEQDIGTPADEHAFLAEEEELGYELAAIFPVRPNRARYYFRWAGGQNPERVGAVLSAVNHRAGVVGHACDYEKALRLVRQRTMAFRRWPITIDDWRSFEDFVVEKTTPHLGARCAMRLEPRPITHVAVRFRDQVWSLPRPYRHHHVIGVIVRLAEIEHVDGSREDQGFLDAAGRYLTRGEAEVVARANGQIKGEGGRITGGVLTSEDLW